MEEKHPSVQSGVCDTDRVCLCANPPTQDGEKRWCHRLLVALLRSVHGPSLVASQLPKNSPMLAACLPHLCERKHIRDKTHLVPVAFLCFRSENKCHFSEASLLHRHATTHWKWYSFPVHLGEHSLVESRQHG